MIEQDRIDLRFNGGKCFIYVSRFFPSQATDVRKLWKLILDQEWDRNIRSQNVSDLVHWLDGASSTYRNMIDPEKEKYVDAEMHHVMAETDFHKQEAEVKRAAAFIAGLPKGSKEKKPATERLRQEKEKLKECKRMVRSWESMKHFHQGNITEYERYARKMKENADLLCQLSVGRCNDVERQQ